MRHLMPQQRSGRAGRAGRAGRFAWRPRGWGLAAGLLWALLAGPVQAAPVCGPGLHWVDACPAGIDFFPLTNGFHTIEIFGFGSFNLFTTGPTTIWRGAGTTVPDHHIDTEMVALQLVGGGLTLTAGDGVADGLCGGPLCSLGRITEQGGNPQLADSFFDIFFEIQGAPLGALGPLHNNVACHMEAVLDRVPPAAQTTYVCNQATTGPVFLYNAGNQQVGRLTATSHTILPEPGGLALTGLALLVWAGLRGRPGWLINQRPSAC